MTYGICKAFYFCKVKSSFQKISGRIWTGASSICRERGRCSGHLKIPNQSEAAAAGIQHKILTSI